MITFLLILCELINTFNWLPRNRTYEKLRKTNQILKINLSNFSQEIIYKFKSKKLKISKDNFFIFAIDGYKLVVINVESKEICC